jgi:hypothetical protein
MPFVSGETRFGKNRCQDSNHFEDDPGDYIHRADNSKTWLDDAYGLVQVEGEGPFAEYWYLNRGKVQLVRDEFINSRLTDDTADVYRLNARNRNLEGLRLIAQQVRSHERTHSDLMIEALTKAGDPAIKIERLLHRDPEDLQKKADDVIRTVNAEIMEATTEEKVKRRLGQRREFQRKACIFTADARKLCFEPVANISD